jgi:preprotein translocase SecE subunit
MFAKITNYFNGVVSEAKKVNWPGKKKVIEHSVIVVAAVIVTMFVFGFFDYGND